MKKIPFNLFGEEEELKFDLNSLEEFELAMGLGINQIVFSQNEGIHFCLTALPFCLKKLNRDVYVKKIEEYLESGGRLSDISSRIIHAIWITKIVGDKLYDIAFQTYFSNISVKNKEKTTKNA